MRLNMHRGIKQHINNGTIGRAQSSENNGGYVLEAPYAREIGSSAMLRMREERVGHLIDAFGPGQPIANKVDAYFQVDPGGYKESGYRWALLELDKTFGRLFGEDSRNRPASRHTDDLDYNTLNDPDITGRAGRFGREHTSTFDLINGRFPTLSTTEAQICKDFAIPSALRWNEEVKEQAMRNAPWHQSRR